jgi:hypothetical protein
MDLFCSEEARTAGRNTGEDVAAYLDMERAASVLGSAVVVELQPRLVLVEAGPFQSTRPPSGAPALGPPAEAAPTNTGNMSDAPRSARSAAMATGRGRSTSMGLNCSAVATEAATSSSRATAGSLFEFAMAVC